MLTTLRCCVLINGGFFIPKVMQTVEAFVIHKATGSSTDTKTAAVAIQEIEKEVGQDEIEG